MSSVSGISGATPRGAATEEESGEDRVYFLPEGVNFNVFSNLNPSDLLAISLVCRNWKNLTSNDNFWKGFIPENIIQKNKDITDCKKYVKDRTISEDEVAFKIKDFNNSIKQNETGRISFRFLDDRTKDGFLEIGKFSVNKDDTTLRSDEDLKSAISENPLKEMIYFVKRSINRQTHLEIYKRREFESSSNFQITAVTRDSTKKSIFLRYCLGELRLDDSEQHKLDSVLSSMLMGKDIDVTLARELFPEAFS